MSDQTLAQPTTPVVSPQTTRLVTGGVLAGPVFLVVWALLAVTRDGFDPSRHPISLLGLGDLGWIQMANFVVTGSLFLACAVGVRRVLQPGPGATWGPGLIVAMGAGLIIAGAFPTDAGAGFPAGAPTGAPEMSWHGVVHEIGFVVVMLSWTAACFVLRRRFARRQERGLASACIASVFVVLAVSAWPDPDSLAIRLVVATAIQFGLMTVLAMRLRRGL